SLWLSAISFSRVQGPVPELQRCQMSEDWLDLLKTVCAAGRARAVLDSKAYEGLEQLRKAGLLEIDHAPATQTKYFTPMYHPTPAGRALYRKLSQEAPG